MAKRFFDIFFSFLGLVLLSPLFLIIALFVSLESGGGIFFRQKRVGLNGKDFMLFKFRTMKSGSDKAGLITIGNKDSRITSVGYFLRKYKLDEFPQLINVLIGDMSIVGPRPEVRKYVDKYNAEQLQVLELKPGITDYASISYSDESELLAKAENPEAFYIREVMPAKLRLNLQYKKDVGMLTDMRIIVRTIAKIWS